MSIVSKRLMRTFNKSANWTEYDYVYSCNSFLAGESSCLADTRWDEMA